MTTVVMTGGGRASCAPVRATLTRRWTDLSGKAKSGRHPASAAGHFWLYGAAQESNLPSLGLPDLTGFEAEHRLAQPSG